MSSHRPSFTAADVEAEKKLRQRVRSDANMRSITYTQGPAGSPA